ncbi:MAG: hypothetical protein K2X11_09750 [Acetobacteraceae bacterium]|nr:hypothetical protein [Acetobacteraceae bacterium]
MIWIPLCLMGAALLLAHAQAWGVEGTTAGREAPGLVVVFVVSAVWFVVALFSSWDPAPAAAAIKQAALDWAAQHPWRVTAALAALGTAIGFVGMGHAAQRVVTIQTDPDAPLQSFTVPVMISGAGAVLVALAFLR